MTMTASTLKGINVNQWIVFSALFLLGLAVFFFLAVAFRLLLNKLMGKHVERFAKGGFLSDFDKKTRP